jgi:DNA-binding IclR family transcriptional regulator
MLKNLNIAHAENARPAAGLESVDLTLRLIELLASASSAKGVTEVAGDLGISKPRAHRHLRCLVDMGYARQDPYTEGYEIGARVLALGNAARARYELIELLRPVMLKLSQESGFTVTLAALIENHVTVLEMIAGANPLDFSVKPGARLDFQRSAHGLVAMAFGPEDLRTALSEHPDAAELKARIAGVRAAGWATSIDSVEYWANALAAPVFDAKGRCRGSIAIAGASAELPAQPGPQQIAWLTSAAAAASQTLGWRGGQI